jgi:hypothetical protein
MEIEYAFLLTVPLHVNGVSREGARHEPSVAGSFSRRPLQGDVEDVRSDVFADVPALGRSPDHVSDCVPDHIVALQEIGEASEIVVSRRAHACARVSPGPLIVLDIQYRTHILCAQQGVVKMKKSDRTAVTALAIFFVGLWLLSNPNCGTGCQTVAEHLVKHGITGLFG